MTRLVFVAAVAAAVLGTACEKSKSGGEEAPIQKGSSPKPLPPPAAKPDEVTPPAPPTGGADGDPHGAGDGHDHGGGGAPGASAPPPVAPAPSGTVGAAPAMDTVRPPVAADLPVYLAAVKGKGTLRADIETSLGTFHCTLLEKEAPMTVANFVGLATGQKPWTDPKTSTTMKGKPFFDGLIFHRVIPGFMVQGGDPLGQGVGGPGYNFADEIAPGLAMDKAGILAMANAGPGPTGGGTNGSQFFITEKGATWLTGKHTIFGQCAEVDLVSKITGVDRDPGDRPKTPVVIKAVKILRK